MQETDRQRITRSVLSLNDPPWFENPPIDFAGPTKVDVYRWFRRQARPICVLVTLSEFKMTDHGLWTTESIELYEKHLTGKTTDIEKNELSTLADLRHALLDHGCAMVFREFLNVAMSPKPNSFLAYIYHQEMYTRWVIQCDHDRDQTRARHAAEIWRSHRNVVRQLQNVFAPPAEFYPKSAAEWIIAGDLLEEAGELRSQAIRAAVHGDSDDEILAAICNALLV